MDNDTAPTPRVAAAIAHLERYGYCVLPGLVPGALARALAARCLKLHAEEECRPYIVGDEHYQTLFGMLNLDDRTWQLAGHPDAVAVARHFLGPHCRVVEACSKLTWPGAPHQHLHVDSAGHFHEVPDVPWMINSIWMLTDFTEDNGATGIVPLSHRSKAKSPPPDLDVDGELVKTVTGSAGSLIMWHGGAYHMARANTGDSVRVGLNVAYYPRWFNNWIENGHQPIWLETYARMPEEMQALCTGRQARHRDEAYEKR
jgi:hypothetical protein